MKPNLKANLHTLLYSGLGVALVFILLLAINVIVGLRPVRMDLTAEKAYTLSEGTRSLLRSLDTPVKIRFYCTRSETATPEVIYLRSFARRVEDLLAEYKHVAGSKLIIEKYDPQPESDAEDSARMDGLEPRQLPAVDRFYLGLCVSVGDDRETIPFLEPTMERLLEYQITRAIARVINPEKPVIGVMSSLPVFGSPANPFRAQMGQQPMQPWAFLNELKLDYNIRRIDTDTDKIDDDIRLLMLIHPKDLSEKTLYAIDQFLMRGGRLMVFVDPLSVVDGRLNPMFGGAGSGSNLEKLFKAWGYSFENTKAVADVNFMLQVRSRTGGAEEAPVWLNVSGPGINHEDVATAAIDAIWMPVVGAFTGQPAAGLKETVLLRSTDRSQLVDAFLANMSGRSILRDFKPTGVNYKLALRLTGRFKTAFPDGPPSGTSTNDLAGTTTNAAPGAHLKESTNETSVVIFGDADFLYDDFMLRRIDTPFGQLVAIMNGNLALICNLVDQLAGDTRLVAVRSRAEISRPFTRVRAMIADAEQRYRAEIKRLEDFIDETQRKINELQAQKTDPTQRYILTPEQRAELEKLRKEEIETRKRLKQVNKELTRTVRSLENRIKWINMLTMPLVVAVTGLAVGVVRSRRTAAR